MNITTIQTAIPARLKSVAAPDALDACLTHLPGGLRTTARRRLNGLPEHVRTVLGRELSAVECKGLFSVDAKAAGRFHADEKRITIGVAQALPRLATPELATLLGIVEVGARAKLLGCLLDVAGVGTWAATAGVSMSISMAALGLLAPEQSALAPWLTAPISTLALHSGQDVLVHESAHALDAALGRDPKNQGRPLVRPEYGQYYNGAKLSGDYFSVRCPEMIQLFEDCQRGLPGHKFITNYAGTHPVEYFAESVTAYFHPIDQHELKEKDPGMFAWVDKIVRQDLRQMAGESAEALTPLEAVKSTPYPKQLYVHNPKDGFYVGDRLSRHYKDLESLIQTESLPAEGLEAVKIKTAANSAAKVWTANLCGLGLGLLGTVYLGVAVDPGLGCIASALLPATGAMLGNFAVIRRSSATMGTIQPAQGDKPPSFVKN